MQVEGAMSGELGPEAPASPAHPIGPIGEAVRDRAAFGPIRRLEPQALRLEQAATRASPRRKPTVAARGLFTTIDALYGRSRSLDKFRVLEVVARVPYQAWENVAYVALTHTARRPGFARRIFETVRVNRWEQDNEQWHLLILEELTAASSRLGWVRRQAIPQILAFGYYWFSWTLFVIKPAWSYRLNADFEDHAEHEYALAVDEHPEWESAAFESRFESDFGSYRSWADLFRQIGYDERLHKLQSEAAMEAPRFS